MKASIKVVDNVIIRCFEGDVYIQNIIDLWDETLARYANLHHEDSNMKHLQMKPFSTSKAALSWINH